MIWAKKKTPHYLKAAPSSPGRSPAPIFVPVRNPVRMCQNFKLHKVGNPVAYQEALDEAHLFIPHTTKKNY